MATKRLNYDYESEDTANAKAKAQSYSPDNYVSKYNTDSYLNKYLNYGDFSYDQNSDALYNDYKTRYTKLGQNAMKDTMGQAAALTGGYGNSYATYAAQSAYNDYMDQLADKGLELRNQAYTEWQNGKSDAYNAYNAVANADATDYSRWNDNGTYWNNLYSTYASQDQNAISNAESQYQYDTTLAENQRQYNTTLAANTSSASSTTASSSELESYRSAAAKMSASELYNYCKYLDDNGLADGSQIYSIMQYCGITDPTAFWNSQGKYMTSSSGDATVGGNYAAPATTNYNSTPTESQLKTYRSNASGLTGTKLFNYINSLNIGYSAKKEILTSLGISNPAKFLTTNGKKGS